MAILITCVGTSDPIRGEHDGAVLHILRHNPDITKCYIFYSKSLYEIHKDKNRNYFNKAYNTFCEENNRNIEMVDIPTEIDSVHLFNVFYDDFKNKIQDIIKEEGEQKIYVNLTSGTPQMQITLSLICQSLSYIDFIPLQVLNWSDNSKVDSDPANPSNTIVSVQCISLNYNIDKEIEKNRDKDTLKSRNRCQIVDLYAVFKNDTINELKKSINDYSYNYLSDNVQKLVSANSKLKPLILFLKYRQKMNYDKANKILKEAGLPTSNYLPFYSDKRKNDIFEYFLLLKNLLKTEQYNDFIVRMDLFAIELQIEVLKKVYGFDIKDYKEKKYFSSYKVFQENPELYCHINDSYRTKIKHDYVDGYVNIMLLNVIMDYFSNKSNFQYLQFFNDIEKLHDKRNYAAHTLTVTKKEDITNVIGIDNMINNFQNVLKILYPDITDKHFNSYDIINEEIIKLI